MPGLAVETLLAAADKRGVEAFDSPGLVSGHCPTLMACHRIATQTLTIPDQRRTLAVRWKIGSSVGGSVQGLVEVAAASNSKSDTAPVLGIGLGQQASENMACNGDTACGHCTANLGV